MTLDVRFTQQLLVCCITHNLACSIHHVLVDCICAHHYHACVHCWEVHPSQSEKLANIGVLRSLWLLASDQACVASLSSLACHFQRLSVVSWKGWERNVLCFRAVCCGPGLSVWKSTQKGSLVESPQVFTNWQDLLRSHVITWLNAEQCFLQTQPCTLVQLACEENIIPWPPSLSACCHWKPSKAIEVKYGLPFSYEESFEKSCAKSASWQGQLGGGLLAGATVKLVSLQCQGLKDINPLNQTLVQLVRMSSAYPVISVCGLPDLLQPTKLRHDKDPCSQAVLKCEAWSNLMLSTTSAHHHHVCNWNARWLQCLQVNNQACLQSLSLFILCYLWAHSFGMHFISDAIYWISPVYTLTTKVCCKGFMSWGFTEGIILALEAMVGSWNSWPTCQHASQGIAIFVTKIYLASHLNSYPHDT